ncbi:lamin tail domain-containing protein [Pseudochryseolinea flava]|uniref:LTD domain-containing protein n=1 Tax=Pseudochryseolinea flava TaxID=2059302 RepID=A0A364YA90_9BACT|nr:lamin tail domain-containing protein [Pseudochryseolinea flava]RAW03082.1 hypothetical protein DQQ10_03010 [Pseudochryseolinea flava]
MKKINQKFSFCILKTFTEKILITFFVFYCSQQMFAQVSDNFADGNFSSNPIWQGNDSSFSVIGEILQLTSLPQSATKYLSTVSSAINNASWVCRVRLNFNPSSSNFARFYLASDQPDLTQDLNGYFVSLGGSDDEVCLYKQTGTTVTKIIDGPDGELDNASVDVAVKVEHDANGQWILSRDLSRSGQFLEIGRADDNQHIKSLFSGIYCRFTTTRSSHFFFDDFQINGEPYTPPPAIDYKDLIITEIFADPSPSEQLPESEFIELLNRSNNTISLEGISISDGTTTTKFSGDKVPAGEYIIVCSSSSASDYAPFGRVVPVVSFPSLHNDGERLTLKKDEKLIEEVEYTIKSYHHNIKADGGWTLELIDINNKCSDERNWSASEDQSGGTPGKINSIAAEKPDRTAPVVERAVASADSLFISFDERIDLPTAASFSIRPTTEIQSIHFINDRNKKIVVKVGKAFERDTNYELIVNNIRDCSGNLLENVAVQFAVPQDADSMDIVLNEILFNPRPTGVDFIELYNASKKHVNLKNWTISRQQDGRITDQHAITNEDIIFKPGSYALLTVDGDIVSSEYANAKRENFLVVDALTPMNDDEGEIILRDAGGRTIDQFMYNETMHEPFIKDEEGVSLERIEANASTQSPSNWKSAAATAGFGTPGLINSMTRSTDVSVSDNISISPPSFVPQNALQSFTQIHYNFDKGGLIGNVRIIDANGRPIRTLAVNTLLSTNGFFRWDGDRDDGLKARVGYYMVHVEVFDSTGNVSTYKEPVAIGF